MESSAVLPDGIQLHQHRTGMLRGWWDQFWLLFPQLLPHSSALLASSSRPALLLAAPSNSAQSRLSAPSCSVSTADSSGCDSDSRCPSWGGNGGQRC